MEFSNYSRRGFLGAVLAVGAGIALRSTGEAAMQSATPAAGFPTSLLDRALDPGVSLTSEMAIYATFADLEAETIATGVARPDGTADRATIGPWLSAMIALALPQRLGNYALDPRWVEFTGFDITQVDQAAEIGEPPAQVSMYAGRFDRSVVLDAWKAAAYNEIQSGDIAIWSISEDNSFSIDNPVQQLFLSGHNNAACLNDDLIVFAPTLALLKEAVSAATGETASLGQNALVAELLAASPTLVTGALVNGPSLMWSLDPSIVLGANAPEEAATAIAEQMARPQMAPIMLALIGVTGGGPIPTPNTPDATPIPTPETATMEIALLMPSAEAAADAVEIAQDRLATMDSFATRQPYQRFFSSWEGSVAQDAPVALLSLTLGEALPNIWYRLLFNRDLGFIG
jgi:hypothetical protein